MRNLVFSLSVFIGAFGGIGAASASIVEVSASEPKQVYLPIQGPQTLIIQSSVTAIHITETLRNWIELSVSPGHGQFSLERPSQSQIKLVVTSSDIKRLEVHVPKDSLAHLKVVTESGAIILGGDGYEMATDNRRIDLSSKSGAILVQGQVWHEAHLETSSGDIFLEDNRGALTIFSQKGNTQIGSHSGPVQATHIQGQFYRRESVGEAVVRDNEPLIEPKCGLALSDHTNPFSF